VALDKHRQTHSGNRRQRSKNSRAIQGKKYVSGLIRRANVCHPKRARAERNFMAQFR